MSAAALGLWGLWRGRQAPAPGPGPASGALPEQHQKTLAALVDTLLPREGDAPGGLEAGVMTYLERELARDELASARRLCMRGAMQLDRVAQARSGSAFAAASTPERDAVVGAMLAGEGRGPGFDPPRFVHLVLSLALEGLFGDPAHGGNRDGVGWRFAGYDMGPPRPLACLSEHGDCK